ncbi:trehalose-phosphatase [Pseudomonas sp. EpS/L25]|uniref:trehalose-phosphatase n=1 Tax=Pseudomonas sp. EpS/L25 TaxID=1749078 RepID=UPI00074440C2|nr:trehalose-phosphatase [Pseudomonas sp. EpS/L25]KUM43658.1 trehalose phosphatase [Pseudomonas sp. EpS/L25]
MIDLDSLTSSGQPLAFFFDLDGTLAELQPRPEQVFIPAETLAALEQLARRYAVAVVSGRPLAEIDGFTAPLRLPAAGVHGAEWRDPQGELHRVTLDGEVLAQVGQRLEAVLGDHPDLLLERKSVAFALHYRQAPEKEALVHELAAGIAAEHPEFKLQPGKCVFELKPAAASKGEAVARFMELRPFAGCLPVFVGDDRTDEEGFAVVNARGGLSVKVGEGETVARARLPSVVAVARWLQDLSRDLAPHYKQGD